MWSSPSFASIQGMCISKCTGWRSWRHQAKKPLVAIAVVATLGAVYQTWASLGSTGLWLPALFVSPSASSALQAQSTSVSEVPKFISFPGKMSTEVMRDHEPAPDPIASEVLKLQQQSTVRDTQAFQSAVNLEGNWSDKSGNDRLTDTNGNITESYFADEKTPSPVSGHPLDREAPALELNSTKEICCYSTSNQTADGETKLDSSMMSSAPAPEKNVDLVLPSTTDHVSALDHSNMMESSTARARSSAFQTSDGGLDLNSSISLPPAPGLGNGKDLLLPSSANEKPRRPLSKPEQELYSAKEAIADAPLINSLYSDLYAPLYHNLSQFKRSYELMEKMFRVYVYKEGRKSLVHTGPISGIYASEGLFIYAMEHNRQFAVKNPEEAHAFFLPYSVANMVTELYVPNSHTMLPLATFIKQYVELIAARHPFWNRTKGGDHFFVSCHDWGPATARDHKELRQNAIKVVCNADVTEEFVTGRDASLPEFYSHWTKLKDVDLRSGRGGGVPGPNARAATLAFFAGQMHGRVRPELLRHWSWPKGGAEMQIYGVLPAAEVRRRSYEQRMKASKYCICPMGYEVNSPRIVEAILAGCVPVIIADGFVMPFAEVLDWSAFSVTVAEADIRSLKSILTAIPERRYRSMQRRLRDVRRHFTWHYPPVPFDTFHMILHSVWTSRLRNLI